jgi:hypothetical protein
MTVPAVPAGTQPMVAPQPVPPEPAQSVPAVPPQGVIATLDADVRRGYRTTEFWVAISTWLLPILALFLHKDLSSLAVPLATLAAGIANGLYAVSRALTKSGHAQAVAAASGPHSAASGIDAAAITAWATSMAGAVQALTAALASKPGPPVAGTAPVTDRDPAVAQLAGPVSGNGADN